MDKIKFGILGFGLFGEKRLIPGFEGSQYAELVAISKTNIETAREKAEKYNIPKYYDSVDELVNDKEIDAIFIASPNNLHKDHVFKAAMAGKHILLEKPMAMNSQECEEMLKVCEENNVKIMIGHCFRFNDAILEIKRMIDEGELGKIIAINGKFYYDATLSARKWIFNKEMASGGPIADLGVHMIDAIRFLTGKEVNEVKFLKRNSHKNSTFQDGTPCNSDVETKAHIILDLEGIYANIAIGFEGHYITGLELIGEKCAIYVPYVNQINRNITIHIYKNLEESSKIIENKNMYVAEIDAFSKAILYNDPIPIPGKEGLKNQQVLDDILY